VKKNRASTGLAIAISHKRALDYALQTSLMDPHKGLILVLEEDVIPRPNCLHHILLMIKHMAVQQSLQKCQLVTLTYGNDQHPLAMKVMKASEWSTIGGTQHSLGTFRMIKWPRGWGATGRLDWVGNGARALCYRHALARFLVQAEVDDFYDKWVMKVMSKPTLTQKFTGIMNADLDNGRNVFAACLWPACFDHPIDDADRMRGSGRLHMEAMENEAIVKHICLDLGQKKYGLGNLLQTFIFYCHVSAQFGAGLVVRWPAPKEGLEDKPQTIFRIDQEAVNMMRQDWPTLAYFRVFEHDDGQFEPYKNSKTGCIAVIHDNVEIQRGRNFLAEVLPREAEWKTHSELTGLISTNANTGYHDEWWDLLQPAAYWEFLADNCELLKGMKEVPPDTLTFVAVHVRKGDMYGLHCTDAVNFNREQNRPNECTRIELMYTQAEQELKARFEKYGIRATYAMYLSGVGNLRSHICEESGMFFVTSVATWLADMLHGSILG